MKKLPLLLSLLVLGLPLAAAAQRVDPVYIEDRLNQLQQAITSLTGQIEQLQYRNQQLQQQLEKMRTDYEFRIEQLEKGGGRPGGGTTAAPGLTPPVKPGGPTAAAGTPQQQYDEALKLFQAEDYAGAERAFAAFLQRHPQHALAGNAQYWLGDSYFARKDYASAARAFAEGYKNYRSSPKGPDNLIKLGMSLAAQGRKQDACAVFARFGQDYPKASEIQKRVAEQQRQRNQCG